jgi:hypothetical protein
MQRIVYSCLVSSNTLFIFKKIYLSRRWEIFLLMGDGDEKKPGRDYESPKSETP